MKPSNYAGDGGSLIIKPVLCIGDGGSNGIGDGGGGCLEQEPGGIGDGGSEFVDSGTRI